MHPAAMNAVVRILDAHKFKNPKKAICEIGSFDVNGSVRPLFGGCDKYVGVDTRAGAGVDEVADGATYGRASAFDVVITTETLEHAPEPEAIVANAFRILKPGGLVVITAAAPGRDPHNCDGSGPPRESETYANVDPVDLTTWLKDAGFEKVKVELNERDRDVYAHAVKPKATTPKGDSKSGKTKPPTESIKDDAPLMEATDAGTDDAADGGAE